MSKQGVIDELTKSQEYMCSLELMEKLQINRGNVSRACASLEKEGSVTSEVRDVIIEQSNGIKRKQKLKYWRIAPQEGNPGIFEVSNMVKKRI
ncbi:hypothetical protein K9M79_02955 [Candidatus Woesearchaeota archaeon]|nr:hypothetical protein [Candidatus Woesearchaeota archaeon]